MTHPLGRLLAALGAVCVLLAVAHDARAQNLTADYRFEDSRASSVGAAPDLVDIGSNTFATETVDGAQHRVLVFAQNQGLSLSPAAGVMPSDRYTVVLLFRFQEVSGYRRVLDFQGGASDNGAYIKDGHLEHSNGSDEIRSNTYVQVVYTRDGTTASQRAYVDGVVAVDGTDSSTSDLTLLSSALRFFRDDNMYGGEASAGAVARIRIYDGPLTADQVAALDRTAPPAGSATTDLALSFDGLAPSAGSGSLYTLAVRVENRSATDTASSVSVTTPTPLGSGFSSASSSQGQCAAPPLGSAGEVKCSLGSLGPGAVASVTVVVDVAAAAGATLSASSSVTTTATDPDHSNDSAVATIPVVESGTASLTWDAPEPPSSATPLPPPQRLVVVTLTPPGALGFGPARARRDGITGYNVYRSNKPGVAPSPGNLYTSLPPSQTSTNAPIAPGGTFFVITGVYGGGESGPSNEGSAGVPAGTIAKIKLGAAKIAVTGSGFSDAVSVFVDGIPFVSQAVVKKSNTKVVQKGALLTGASIGQYFAAHPTILVTVRNSNGGVAASRYPN